MEISTYQRSVQVQTGITRMTTVVVITKTESLTLILDRIEAHISLPNHDPLLSILRFETPQRDASSNKLKSDLSCSIPLIRGSAPIVVFCLRNGGRLPSLAVLHAPVLRCLLEFGFINPAFSRPRRIISKERTVCTLSRDGGRLFSRRESIRVWVGGRLRSRCRSRNRNRHRCYGRPRLEDSFSR